MSARAKEMHALYVGGATMREIATAYGVSPQRVSQIFEQHNLDARGHSGTRADPLAILRVARGPGVTSLEAVADRVGCLRWTVSRVLDELGVAAAVHRLWRWRRRVRGNGRRRSDVTLLDALRSEAKRIGRTPNIHDMNAPESSTPCHMTYVNRFGSIRAAQIAAGLEPNGRGGAGHRDFGGVS